MKNTKIKIILSTAVFLSVISFINTVDAAGAFLYFYPTNIAKTVGDAFDVFVGFNASGNKVCAVDGTLVFNNLTCQSITVADDVMVQSSPTCSSPYFLIGIPNCTASDKALLTLSVKAENAGPASIAPAGVDIVGEGVSVGSAPTSGEYAINAVPTPSLAPIPTPTPTPIPETTIVQKEESAAAPVIQATPENNISADVGAASVATARWTDFLRIILIIAVILCAVYGIYYFVNKKK